MNTSLKSWATGLYLTMFALICGATEAAANASGPNFSGLTGQINWGTAISAILMVMGGLAGVFVVMTGGSLILSKLRGR